MALESTQLAELALLLCAKRAELDLTEEKDEKAALRKALLVLAALNQDNPSPAAKTFSRYILTSFAPLSSYLDHFNHEIWDGQMIGIRANAEGHPVVVIKRDTVTDLMERFAREDSATQRELVLQLPVSSNTEKPWSITADRFVGFFDVMGFSKLVRDARDDNRKLYSTMRGLHDAARLAEQFQANGDQYSQRLSETTSPSGQLKVLQFSDSILVITDDASPASALLIQMASQILFFHALKQGVILRGAVARGIVTVDFVHSIFLGQPIVDAYQLEEAQQWYGVALHPTAEMEEPLDVPQIDRNDVPIVEVFDVELKGRDSPHRLSVINWPVFVDNPSGFTALLRPFDGSGSAEVEKLRAYHAKTLAFAQSMWQKYRG